MGIAGIQATPGMAFEWWSWVLSIPDAPPGNHPARGGNIHQNQNKPFFCQICTIDSGTALARAYDVHPQNAAQQILIPVLTAEASTAENPGFTDDQLLYRATHDLISADILFLNIDDQYILTPENASQYYVESAANNIVVVGNNVLGISPGPTKMRCVGYFVLIDPFPAGSGTHSITFGGSAGPSGNRIQTLVHYEVTV